MLDTASQLSESRNPRLFPAPDIDCPAHLRLASLAENFCPNLLVALIRSHAQAIHNSRASCEFTLRFYIDVVSAPISSHSRVQGKTHGNRIGHRNSFFSSLHLVGLTGEN